MHFMKAETISKCFIAAGLSNILGVLILSRLFTNEVMMNTQPEVMGYFGLISIILWGFAYIAVHTNYDKVPWLIVVFTVEKVIYVSVYLKWFMSHSLSEVYDQDMFAGIFYTIYGLNDFIWMVFFSYVWGKIKSIKEFRAQ